MQSKSGHRTPRLFKNTSAFLLERHAVGDMVFDPERMCWLGNEAELENFDFASDDEPGKLADLKGAVESGSQRLHDQLMYHEKNLQRAGTNMRGPAQVLLPTLPSRFISFDEDTC